MKNKLFAALGALQLAAGISSAQTSVPVNDFDVYVDPPTAFVFLKLPAGWKFVGKLRPEDLRSLPTTVHTSLLREESALAATPLPDAALPQTRVK